MVETVAWSSTISYPPSWSDFLTWGFFSLSQQQIPQQLVKLTPGKGDECDEGELLISWSPPAACLPMLDTAKAMLAPLHCSSGVRGSSGACVHIHMLPPPGHE